ncbi:MAG: PD-(D/E)XK nuclease-like domain-containing protein [Liquorilactobacillus nagelii]|uniref:PD-(D/E)XK nuclease-like domain-containing protein n=1 Tax=Oenococcus sicerae TaxID=2203724 RepID=UPI0039E9FDD6
MSQNSTQSLKQLTQNNYYTHETDWQYMSFSLYKDFKKCEAAALAKLKENWQPTSNPVPLLVGNYVHSYFESQKSHESFIAENESAMMSNRGKSKGQLKAPFKVADSMIDALKDDYFFRQAYLPGDKEKIVTGEINGVVWKGKIDSLNLDAGYFCDLKTVDDINKKHWNTDLGRYTNFIFDRGYHLQMAIYKELIKQTFGIECEPLIFAVSKQDPPAKLAIDFTDTESLSYMSFALQELEDNQKHILDVMHGEIKPKRCEKCEYCRQTAMLSGFTHASEIELG